MNKTDPLPVARTWRDIPQQVKPRAMSREGKRRVAWRAFRLAVGITALAGVAVAGWEVASALRPGTPKAVARPAPIGDHVILVTNGVLDRAWLLKTLALRREATLADIDPAALRARLVLGGQVAAADLVRRFPRTLEVHLAERMPVARLMLQGESGAPRPYLVDREGVVYAGAGYDPAMIATLPWLDGVRPVPGTPGVARVAGMEAAAEFLARAKFDAERLYRSWRVISLARLEADGLIEVRTEAGTRVLFGTRGEDLYPQLARLDTLLDELARGGAKAPRQIDLYLGPNVPVAFSP